jgi:prophage tail gpP-like protein
VRRYRPLTLFSDEAVDKGGCEQRAAWQRNTHYGRSRGVVYTVLGWQQGKKNAPTWTPNQLVKVKDAYMGFDDVELLIVEAQLLLDEQGMRTELQLMPAAAFKEQALAEPDGKTEGFIP